MLTSSDMTRRALRVEKCPEEKANARNLYEI